ncbi:nucleoside-diphosphate-sugar epimerase [Aspergillus bombycis]|uniref:Succinate-semialdehyde dehydrogenase, mitochondrial n=1 Tax=Aspergillus bombycis TaxID=109264 RepID=A0A1F7ZPS8_9EURO|nr:nucleoside-diphosphate-sugar epimerase [Aspergillus bombycis]OGM41055.1 nucleoside-diphosphate-sugar epimerase [Aspergillus bombycis]
MISSQHAGSKNLVIRQPVGVCAIIAPWNFPVAMITRKLGPVIAAGCTAVAKPPREASLCATALAHIALEAGLPTEVVQVTPCTDRVAVTELYTNPLVRKVSFTGSTDVGKVISEHAVRTMKRISMELGGNAPLIVFDDADMDAAVEGAVICKFRCSGQTCVCANRIYVHRACHDIFVQRLSARIQSFKVGPGLSPDVTHGPLINRAAVEKAQAHIDDTLNKGATLVTWGKTMDGSGGFFIEPTLLVGITSEMAVVCEETFGPLAAITVDEVIQMTNATEYGLAGYLFSQSMNTILRVSAALEVGMLGVNTGKISAAEAPFDSVKESGFGREGSNFSGQLGTTMPTKIFITGVTGYIGGDALYHIHQNHPDFEYSALIRTDDKARKVQAQYPKLRVIIGDLDDTEKIAREAAWADIVIHTADSSDHVVAANAIAEGMVQGHSPERPGYWLHTGGTGILTYFDSDVRKVSGEPDEKVFNDWDGIDELVNLPPAAFHRNVDEIVLKTGVEYADRVKTVIVCPPTIYGPGRGPISGRGRQAYELASFILKQKYTPQIGKGLARWNNVHVWDLSRLFEGLVQAALDPTRANDDEIWGGKGYFLCENGEHIWGDLSRLIGQQAFKLGYLAEAPQHQEWSLDEAVKSPAGFEAASWGWNSRGKALRGTEVLDWKPQERSLEDEVPDLIRSEASRLDL